MKTKVSVSLSEDVVDQLDEEAERQDVARSEMMERICRVYFQMTARQKRQAKLDEETRAYYAGLTAEEQQESKEWSQFSARAARGLKYDE